HAAPTVGTVVCRKGKWADGAQCTRIAVRSRHKDASLAEPSSIAIAIRHHPAVIWENVRVGAPTDDHLAFRERQARTLVLEIGVKRDAIRLRLDVNGASRTVGARVERSEEHTS